MGQQAAMTMRFLTPLPRKVRLRLWRTRKIDGIAIWLVEHDHIGAAIVLWRMFGQWRRPR